MSENSKVRGVIEVIEETKSYGQKGFRKRLVVLAQESPRFTNYVPVEFIQDNCDAVDELKVGDEIEVTYRLSGRKWQKDPSADVKYFVNVEGMSFRVLTGTGSKADAGAAPSDVDPFAEANAEFDDGDVPF